MNVLIITFYYPPDLSAGSFRVANLVEKLLSDVRVDSVTVFTTFPLRYKSHVPIIETGKAEGRLRIIRFKCSVSFSGVLGQTLSFLLFFIKAFKSAFFSKKKIDIVYATSSRMMTGFLGALLSRTLKSFFVIDIRDLFVDVLPSFYPRYWKILKKPLQLVELYTIRSSHKLISVSPGFIPYLLSKFPEADISTRPNGVDNIFITNKFEKIVSTDSINILYAGNIGHGQCLESIIPAFAQTLIGKVSITIIGDGSAKDALVKKTSDIPNVTILPPVERETLLEFYSNSDVLFLQIADIPALRKVIPSKIFEYSATGKPILLGAKGIIRKIAREEIPNVGVFEPGDHVGAIKAFKELRKDAVDRADFVKKYSRDKISQNIVDDILSLYETK